MDVIFNCTNCEQELAVDAAAAGSEIQCPTCNTKLVIPEAEAGEPKPASAAPPSGPIPPPPDGGALPEHSGAMATSAAAKVHVHFSVPMHDKPGETLIKKAAKPLEVAAKDTEKKIRTKTIRHTDCIEVGKDKYDDILSEFLQRVGRENIISINAINYTHVDMGSRALLSEYGVTIIYVG